MFKILSIAVLLYILYKLTFPAKSIGSSTKDQIKGQQGDDTIDIDYEEVD